MNEHELPQILDGIDEPVTVDELDAVVRRAGQRRRATLAAGAAGLLAIGAFGGAAVSWGGSGGPTGYAADQPDPARVKKAEMAAVEVNKMAGMAVTPLFRREAHGVAVRAYRHGPLPEAPAGNPACATPGFVQGQLSNGAAVGYATAPDLPGDSFGVLGTGTFGRDEGDPATWVVVRAGASVATVRLTGGDRTDAMAPNGGIAVLVLPGINTAGTLEAVAADGSIQGTASTSTLIDASPFYGPPRSECMVGPGCVIGKGQEAPVVPDVPEAEGATCGACAVPPEQAAQTKEALAGADARPQGPAPRKGLSASRANPESCTASSASAAPVPSDVTTAAPPTTAAAAP